MSSSGNHSSLPSTLFDVGEIEDDPKTSAAKEEDDSPEFLSLIKDVSDKQARRKSKGKSRTIAASVFDHARHEVQTMMDSGDWDKCGARHLVALYDLMHLKCYGVEALELGATERYNAAMMAAALVKRAFNGDYVEAAEYMNWAWTREIETEKWRRENKKMNVRRIGTRLMFGGALVSDYRLSLARGGSRT